MKRYARAALAAAVAVGVSGAACAGAKRPAPQPTASIPGATLWERPTDLATRDLFNGQWGREAAPDPEATYRLVERKHTGINLGMTVVDSRGREWSVKQPYPGGLDDEAPVEVAVSRLLSAVGYHQPPVYYLSAFPLKDDWGTHIEPGGRFRLKPESLKDVGPWRWEENPFIGTRPYQGLLVLLVMFNDTDLKNSNNSVYQLSAGGRTERWFVVRDVGAVLGDIDRFTPLKGDVQAFEHTPFILGFTNGYVQLAADPWYEKLVRNRITAGDLMWASDLLGEVSDRQMRDAFRAGGFQPAVADRFVRKLRDKVQQGRSLARRS